MLCVCVCVCVVCLCVCVRACVSELWRGVRWFWLTVCVCLCVCHRVRDVDDGEVGVQAGDVFADGGKVLAFIVGGDERY